MNNEERILSILEKHGVMLETISTKVDNLEQGQAVLERELEGVTTRQHTQRMTLDKLDRTNAVFEKSLKHINSVVDKLEQGQAKLEQEVSEVKSDVKAIRTELVYIIEDMDMTDREVQRLAKTI